ncbi:hypothetical protein [Streptomyces sp. NPDC090022]|uniref:hypothetical protein n=1 Tax=Streptomyces sp. NPDC090022 TaxID=3365920 RepID=UPI00382F4DDE
MTWTFTLDLTAHLATAGPAVAAEPVRNTLLLTTADELARRGPAAAGSGSDAPRSGWWTTPDGSVGGAVLCTPPRPLLVGTLPPEAVRAPGTAPATEPLLSGVGGLGPPDPAPAGRARATHAVSGAAYTRGAGQVLLLTDLADLTSNRLYQRLGYRPVEERAVVRPASGTGST